MMLSRETQQLAQRLLDYEAAVGDTTDPDMPPVMRVCEKLRLPLSSIVGVADYRSLLSRALTLAKLEAPSLRTVQVMDDGSLQALGGVEPQFVLCGKRGELLLLAQLLELFLTFLGAALTLQLVEEASPFLKAADESSSPLPFKNILQEVFQLNDVSRRLESLAEEHPVVEDALLCISGNIRNTATTLEILAVIKSKSDALNEDKVKKQPNYLM
jgi:hypothetical protein